MGEVTGTGYFSPWSVFNDRRRKRGSADMIRAFKMAGRQRFKFVFAIGCVCQLAIGLISWMAGCMF